MSRLRRQVEDDTLLGETYDGNGNGNVTATGGKTFSYDSQNELNSANGGAVTVKYDGFGNRVSKTVSGVTTKYLVDDVNPTGLPQVLDEVTGSTVTRTYTYGLQRISENQVIDSVWTPSFYGYDGFGTVRQLTNTAGAVTDTFEYDAFGNAITHTGTTPNNYLYRGEQYDSDLGLYYLRARYYNPATGQFLSRDSKNGTIADPKTLHSYLYVGGDPVNWVDPRGHDLDEDLGRLSVSYKQAVPYANAISCGISVALTFGQGTFFDDLEKSPFITSGSVAATVYGCVTTFATPKGIVLMLDPLIQVGSCALSLYQAVQDENELLSDPSGIDAYRPNIDFLGGVFGCATSAFGLTFGGG
jgi:RHS repeat-associated protein